MILCWRTGFKTAHLVAPFLCISALVLCSGSRIEAAVITTGCAAATSCTLDELFGGGTIQANTLLFSNFALIASSSTDNLPDPLLMTVTGRDDGGANPGPGLLYDFGTQLTVASGGSQNFLFQFTFTVADTLGRAIIRDHSLELLDFVNAGQPGSTFGQLNGTDTLQGGVALGQTMVSSVINEGAGVNVLIPFDQILFLPQSTIDVLTDLNAMTQDQIGVESIEQRFSLVIPEPETIGVVGLALVGFGLLRRNSSNGAW